jgi:hypothetical protein
MATVAREGRMTGSRIDHQVRSSLAPSIFAASIKSFGTLLKACRSKKILNALERPGKISACSLS